MLHETAPMQPSVEDWRANGLPPPSGEPTWEIAVLFPHQGHWTESDYFALDGLREGAYAQLELSNGRLEVLTMPTELHQAILFFLLKVLEAFAAVKAPGKVLFSGMKVRLSAGQYREPDILYMRADHAHRRHAKFWDGADLLMEVVSDDPKDRQRDYVSKPREYAAARVPEYWIVDPREQWIRVLVLDGESYRLHGEFRPGMQATSVVLPGFAVAVDQVLNPPDAVKE